MTKEPILLLGAGGHCKSVIEAIESEGKYEIVGILDMPAKAGEKISGYSVVGTDEEIEDWIAKVPNALVTVGQIKSAAVRIKLYNRLKNAGAYLPVIIASTAYVSRHANIGEGTVIMHQAFVNAGSNIGVNTIINSAAIVEHDAKVGDHSHISTGARINGDCNVGREVMIGSNAVLKNGVTVADNVVVGAGAVVVKNIDEGLTVIGNPSKEIYR